SLHALYSAGYVEDVKGLKRRQVGQLKLRSASCGFHRLFRGDQRDCLDLRVNVLPRSEAQEALGAARDSGEKPWPAVAVTDLDQHIDSGAVERLNLFHPHRYDVHDCRQRRTLKRQADVAGGDPDAAPGPAFRYTPGNQQGRAVDFERAQAVLRIEAA